MADSLTTDVVTAEPLLRVQRLKKSYVSGGRWCGRVPIAAMNDVEFEIQSGQTLALVGASGSGKSTIARCVTRLERPDSGQIWFEGQDIAQLGQRELLPVRMDIQMIFQDAVTSLNPRFSAAEAVEEPLRIQGRSRSERRGVAEAVVREVALSPSWLERSVMDFSGGQRQRLAIARALTTRAKLLVLDEAFSGLDLPTRAQIANLLLDLQEAHGLSYLLISHDLALVAGMADVVAVMAQGRIVEQGPTRDLVANPQHEETKKLLASTRAVESELALGTGASA
jgi:peptide/nickel transport system ATP-binding protein/glutathione transport system ATP-binding protein